MVRFLKRTSQTDMNTIIHNNYKHTENKRVYRHEPVSSIYIWSKNLVAKSEAKDGGNRPIPLCGRRAMHAGSLVSKLLPRKMAVVRLAVLLGRINDYFLLNPRCDRRCFHRSM